MRAVLGPAALVQLLLAVVVAVSAALLRDEHRRGQCLDLVGRGSGRRGGRLLGHCKSGYRKRQRPQKGLHSEAEDASLKEELEPVDDRLVLPVAVPCAVGDGELRFGHGCGERIQLLVREAGRRPPRRLRQRRRPRTGHPQATRRKLNSRAPADNRPTDPDGRPRALPGNPRARDRRRQDHHRQVHDATRDMLDIGNPAPHGD